jgi:acyl-CoA reductase-like NAD-dependent aldehyde dehydrogenase
VRSCYGLPKEACKRVVLDAIAGEATGSPRIVFLHRNMEDVVNASCEALHQPAPARKPTPEERDRILLRAASEGRAVRDEILRKVPSFGRLVRVVCEWLTVIEIDER